MLKESSRKDANTQRSEDGGVITSSSARHFLSTLICYALQPVFSFLCVFASLRETLLVLFLFYGTAFAATPAEFNAANALFDKGDFKGARAGYEAMVQSGNWSANVFYNLGNAAYREGDKGAAVLAYERALKLEPGLPEAKANLVFLRNETGAKLPAVPWYGRALSWPTANESAWLAASAFWGLCFSFAPLVWKGRVASVPAFFCCLTLAWSGAVLTWQHSQGETWIITADRATARTMPADNSSAAAALPMGSHVRLLQDRGAWIHVQLPDNSRGWINTDAVSPVGMAKR